MNGFSDKEYIDLVKLMRVEYKKFQKHRTEIGNGIPKLTNELFGELLRKVGEWNKSTVSESRELGRRWLCKSPLSSPKFGDKKKLLLTFAIARTFSFLCPTPKMLFLCTLLCAKSGQRYVDADLIVALPEYVDGSYEVTMNIFSIPFHIIWTMTNDYQSIAKYAYFGLLVSEILEDTFANDVDVHILKTLRHYEGKKFAPDLVHILGISTSSVSSYRLDHQSGICNYRTHYSTDYENFLLIRSTINDVRQRWAYKASRHKINEIDEIIKNAENKDQLRNIDLHEIVNPFIFFNDSIEDEKIIHKDVTELRNGPLFEQRFCSSFQTAAFRRDTNLLWNSMKYLNNPDDFNLYLADTSSSDYFISCEIPID